MKLIDIEVMCPDCHNEFEETLITHWDEREAELQVEITRLRALLAAASGMMQQVDRREWPGGVNKWLADVRKTLEPLPASEGGTAPPRMQGQSV